jgi:hypothetical protein
MPHTARLLYWYYFWTRCVHVHEWAPYMQVMKPRHVHSSRYQDFCKVVSTGTHTPCSSSASVLNINVRIWINIYVLYLSFFVNVITEKVKHVRIKRVFVQFRLTPPPSHVVHYFVVCMLYAQCYLSTCYVCDDFFQTLKHSTEILFCTCVEVFPFWNIFWAEWEDTSPEVIMYIVRYKHWVCGLCKGAGILGFISY